MTSRCLGRVTGVSAAAGSGGVSGPTLGQSNTELMDIIRQQQRQIEELSRKVDALQGQARAGDREGRHGRSDRPKGRGGSAGPQGQMGARADLLEQGWQLVGARARPPDGRRRRTRRRRRLLQERQRDRTACCAPGNRGQLLPGLEVQVRDRLRRQHRRRQGRLPRVQRRVGRASLRPRRSVQDAELARAPDQSQVHHLHGTRRDRRRVRARLSDWSEQRREQR